jgi:hypothetical protein
MDYNALIKCLALPFDLNKCILQKIDAPHLVECLDKGDVMRFE